MALNASGRQGHAQVGPDPCTGLGVPIGKKLDALLVATAPAPVPSPSPVPVVTLAEALAWAESALPNTFMTQRTAKQLIERGLRAHWPKGTP